MEIANDITSLVGNTPLVKLNRIRKYFDCYPEIIAKLESFNPSASVKDRIAYSMLCKAEEEGLIVPAILDCGDKSLRDLSQMVKDLAQRSASGTLNNQEYTGGTFAISNLGMFDVTSFLAIIHPPQSAVLAVGTVADKPVVRDGELAIAKIMNATISADHRIVDGVEGAEFLTEVKRLLENPMGLVV